MSFFERKGELDRSEFTILGLIESDGLFMTMGNPVALCWIFMPDRVLPRN